MDVKTRNLLHDVRAAAALIERFLHGRDFEDYARDALLRSAVERQFEIVGEALNRVSRIDPQMVERISQHRRIVDFRNILAYGYADVGDAIVWDIARQYLPALREDDESWLASEA